MRIRAGLFSVAVLVIAFAATTSAQVATGFPPFGSFGNGPDAVDLANLNVHLNIPVSSKAGRGLPFAYTLGYDSSVWSPVFVPISGVSTWQPANNWGWKTSLFGYLGYSVTTAQKGCGKCIGDSCPGYITTTTYNGYIYTDPAGTQHSFSVGVRDVYNSCLNSDTVTGDPGWSGTSSDGLFFINIGSPGSDPSQELITTVDGTVLDLQNFTITDRNGNRITATGGAYTDTLGQTALTMAGSGTPSSPITLTYTAPSTGSAKYQINYTSYTVATNFGISGITEYGKTAIALVSSIVLPDTTQYTLTYEATPSTPSSGACTPLSGTYSTNCVTARITSIKLPTGGTITYAYSGGNNGILSDGTAATLTRTTPDGSWTYAHSESGTAWTTLITDPQSNQTNINFQGVYETERQVYQGSTSTGTLLRTVYTCYNGSASPCNSTTITGQITQKSVTVSWPSGSSTLQSKKVSSYNGNALITEVDEYAYGSGAPGSLVRKTLTSYASLGNNILDRPASVTIEDGSSNIKAQTTYCYDEGTPSGTTTCAATGSPTATTGTPQHISVTGSRGNVTTVAGLVQSSTTLGKTYTYYDTGNVNVATDVNGGTTTPSYTGSSCGNSFPTSVTEAVPALSRSMVWNCTGGVLTSVTDENGQSVSYNYTDPDFWRPSSLADQASNVTNYTYTPAAGSTDASVESSLAFNGGNSAANSLVTLDGLGRRLVSQEEETPTGSMWDSVESDYDSLGRPDRTTLPYQAASGATKSSAPANHTTYDALGRATQIADNETTPLNLQFSYTQNDTYRTLGPAPSGENTKRTQYEYDALGRLTSVCEVTSLTGSGTCGQTNTATGYWTEYTYDLLNDLTGVTQNAQASSTQSRSYTYDDLGRMTSELNPETGSGMTVYTYDTDSTCGTSKGDLVKRIDQVGNTVCYAYDALHRLTSTSYPSGSYASVTPSRYLVYDSATVNSVVMAYPKARLAEAYTCFSPCTSKTTDLGFSYTVRGQVSDVYESTPHSTTYYHVTASYWANGAPNVLSNLTGLPTITYGVDGEGRLYSASASSGQNPLSTTSYNTASEPLTVNFGSSDSDSFTYDPNSNRMTKYTFSVNSQQVVGTLTWNSIGTLETLGITDAFNSTNAQTCTYAHDDISRLASDSCTGSGWSQTFTYDAFGNINKSGTQSFQPNYSSSTNHMTSIGSYTPTYDANGNVTADSLNSYAWDSNGHPVTVDGVGATYDALGRMVEQNKSGTYYEIVYSPPGTKLAIMQGTTLQKAFVPLTGGTMAVYNSSGLAYYRHSDWLGSSRLASTTTRTVYYDGAYGPFGEQYANSGTTDLSFTGMNQDTASNVYDFPAREYGIQGRWPSPDPAGLGAVDPSTPQSWNRYAYVLNSPLNLADATGLDPCPPTVICSITYWPLPGPPTSAGSPGSGGGQPCTDLMSSIFDPRPDMPPCGGGTTGGGGGGVGSSGGGGPTTGPVHPNYNMTFGCNLTATGVMSQVESDFSQYANFTGNFGPLDLATAHVTFGSGPVTPGGVIPISDTNTLPSPTYGGLPVPIQTINTSVTVQSVTSNSFSFTTNPGHVLYPATISFTATDAGTNQINFAVQVNGQFASLQAQALYELAGQDLENNIWNHLISSVRGLCTGQP